MDGWNIGQRLLVRVRTLLCRTQAYRTQRASDAAALLDINMREEPGAQSIGLWESAYYQRRLNTVLICNYGDPMEGSGPALLDHRDTVIFLHEFGHLVHALARRNVQWVRLAQPSERDIMEAPSQLLEEWMFDSDVLRRFARPLRTGDPIPVELVESLRSDGDEQADPHQYADAGGNLGYHDPIDATAGSRWPYLHDARVCQVVGCPLLRQVLTDGEWVVTKTRWAGTFLGPFPFLGLDGVEPTGRRFDVDHVHGFRFVDGKIAEHWAVRDDLTMHNQLLTSVRT